MFKLILVFVYIHIELFFLLFYLTQVFFVNIIFTVVYTMSIYKFKTGESFFFIFSHISLEI